MNRGALSSRKLLTLLKDLLQNTIGQTKITYFRMYTENHLPVKQHPKLLPFANLKEVAKLMTEML